MLHILNLESGLLFNTDITVNAFLDLLRKVSWPLHSLQPGWSGATQCKPRDGSPPAVSITKWPVMRIQTLNPSQWKLTKPSISPGSITGDNGGRAPVYMGGWEGHRELLHVGSSWPHPSNHPVSRGSRHGEGRGKEGSGCGLRHTFIKE